MQNQADSIMIGFAILTSLSLRVENVDALTSSA